MTQYKQKFIANKGVFPSMNRLYKTQKGVSVNFWMLAWQKGRKW
jgi:hypothetical protein